MPSFVYPEVSFWDLSCGLMCTRSKLAACLSPFVQCIIEITYAQSECLCGRNQLNQLWYLYAHNDISHADKDTEEDCAWIQRELQDVLF